MALLPILSFISTSGLALALQAVLTSAASVDTSSAPNTSADCTHPSQFFTQLVHHPESYDNVSGSSANATFPQQYQLITDFYRPEKNGPILFYQGAETTSFVCIENFALLDWAKEFGAIVATLEHRFFGDSLPFGNESHTIGAYKSAQTLDNVMQDSVSFIDWVKKNVTTAANSEVIVIGGSYGGFLSTALRLNHPETFYGAISTAAPVRGFAEDANNTTPEYFAWMNWISNVYEDQSASAAAKIKAGWRAFEEVQRAGQYSSLVQDLGLCTAPNSSADMATLRQQIQQNQQFAAQFNYPVANGPLRTPANPLPAVLNATISATSNSAMSALKAAVHYNLNGSACFDWNATDPNAAAIGMAFDYITCLYVPIIVSPVSEDAIFAPATSSFSADCKAKYGRYPMFADELQKRYKYSQADVQIATRILFMEGQYDPTTALGPAEFPSTANRNASRIVYVSKMAHGQDTMLPNAGDSDSVSEARQIEVQTIKEWLGITD